MKKTSWLLLAGLALALVGCARPHWRPPPPAGKTWQYQAQGAFRASTSFGTGSIGPIRYGHAFSTSGFSDMEADEAPDTFWKRQTARSGTFNPHLAQQGEPLTPAPKPTDPEVP